MWSLQDAKNRFSAVVEGALAGVPQKVTRRGKPAVVVVSAAQFEALTVAAGQGRGSFRAHLHKLSTLAVNEPTEPDPAPTPRVQPRDVAF